MKTIATIAHYTIQYRGVGGVIEVDQRTSIGSVVIRDGLIILNGATAQYVYPIYNLVKMIADYSRDADEKE